MWELPEMPLHPGYFGASLASLQVCEKLQVRLPTLCDSGAPQCQECFSSHRSLNTVRLVFPVRQSMMPRAVEGRVAVALLAGCAGWLSQQHRLPGLHTTWANQMIQVAEHAWKPQGSPQTGEQSSRDLQATGGVDHLEMESKDTRAHCGAL